MKFNFNGTLEPHILLNLLKIRNHISVKWISASYLQLKGSECPDPGRIAGSETELLV